MPEGSRTLHIIGAYHGILQKFLVRVYLCSFKSNRAIDVIVRVSPNTHQWNRTTKKQLALASAVCFSSPEMNTTTYESELSDGPIFVKAHCRLNNALHVAIQCGHLHLYLRCGSSWAGYPAVAQPFLLTQNLASVVWIGSSDFPNFVPLPSYLDSNQKYKIRNFMWYPFHYRKKLLGRFIGVNSTQQLSRLN